MNTLQPKVWTEKTLFDRCEEVGECWIWAQSVNGQGHPQAHINGKGGQLVRRWAFTTLLGKEVPPRHVVTTTCMDVRCCNPAHLKCVSYSKRLSLAYSRGDRNAVRESVKRANALRAAGKVSPRHGEGARDPRPPRRVCRRAGEGIQRARQPHPINLARGEVARGRRVQRLQLEASMNHDIRDDDTGSWARDVGRGQRGNRVVGGTYVNTPGGVSHRFNGTSRPAPLDEVLPGHEQDDKVPGGGIVRAVGIVALLAFLANVTLQWVRA